MAELPQATLVPAVSLTPAPWNPRSIKDPRFQNLCASLAADADFLQLRPILATADGTVFAGNMRLRAAQQLGWLEVPAIVVDIPEQLAKERAMRDNAQWGEWEEDDLAKLLQDLKAQGSNLDLLGFDDRDLRNLLDRIGNDGGLTDPDDVPALPEAPISKPGDLYILGDHRLLCGDSTNPHHVTFVVRYRGSTESTKPGSGSVLPGLVLLRAGRWSLRRAWVARTRPLRSGAARTLNIDKPGHSK